ncbi:MAG TPA: hypothetical protein VK988_10665 [Acidimicrobiales bacterium]|nr:hypothetical protein [Acidimicrobiales bacterium]
MHASIFLAETGAGTDRASATLSVRAAPPPLLPPPLQQSPPAATPLPPDPSTRRGGFGLVRVVLLPPASPHWPWWPPDRCRSAGAYQGGQALADQLSAGSPFQVVRLVQVMAD